LSYFQTKGKVCLWKKEKASLYYRISAELGTGVKLNIIIHFWQKDWGNYIVNSNKIYSYRKNNEYNPA
jgi:hypothetical protein